jgi:hypothetical protein
MFNLAAMYLGLKRKTGGKFDCDTNLLFSTRIQFLNDFDQVKTAISSRASHIALAFNNPSLQKISHKREVLKNVTTKWGARI